MKQFLLFLYLTIMQSVVLAQNAFEQITIIDSTSSVVNPNDVTMADLDNDGFQDMLIAGYGNVGWARSIDGQGSFENVNSFFSTGFIDAHKIVSADWDDDGDMDVIFLADAAGNDFADLFYAENIDGAATFAQPISLANINSSYAYVLKVLDKDNDGDMDVMYCPSNNNDLFWLENTDGEATFSEHEISISASEFYSADFTGDELPDLIALTNNQFSAYEQNPDGTFTFLEWVASLAATQGFTITDIDVDGDNDLVNNYRNGSTRRIEWFENTDGLGTFADRQTLFDLPSAGGSWSQKFEVTDIDNDNLQDVVIYQTINFEMSWYKNLGGISFGPENIITDEVQNLSSMTVADVDSDGAKDIVFTDYTSCEYSWVENEDGLGTFSEIQRASAYAFFVNRVDYGDMDGDGDLDLVSSSHADNKVAWYENTNGQGHFGNLQHIISDTTDAARDAFTVDMDGDSDLDVLVMSYLDSSTDEYRLIWFENDGEANFTEHTFESTEEEIIAIEHADVDGDGDVDVISAENYSVLKLYINNGDGTFTAPVTFSEEGFSYLLSLKVADMDGDDDLDVLASYNNDEIIWHENDGTGDLTEKHVIIEEMHYPSAIHAVDIDGDSDNDVLFTNQFVGEVGYFLNEDGEGTFGSPVIVSETPDDPSSMYSLDMDEDGDMDMITNSTEGQKFIWFPNNGNANFGDPIEITSFIGRVNHITSADINADGNPDLITSSYDDDQIAYFKNLGEPFTNTISGVVRLDADANGCDDTDAGIPNLLIQTENDETTFGTFTQADGSYSFQANQDAFTTTILSPLPNYYTAEPATHESDFEALEGATVISDFCIEADQVVNDLSVVIYPDENDPRPGFGASYRIVYKNVGSNPLSGTIDFQFDDSKISFLDASEAIDSQTANTLTFQYSDLNPFETRSIDLEFEVFSPPTTSIDDVLISTATITPLFGEANEEDNTSDLEQVVIGSYDPNDIRVLEGEEITLEEADDYLHYIIRFQNTGTASAINVRVNNVLDQKLDWSTIQLESYSHQPEVEITDGNNVDFIFNEINLPDSTSDEANSHGFIAYRIKPKSDVVVGDIFSSTANIYFDFNPPIVTNTATTEIIPTVSVSDIEADAFKWYPNPTSSTLTIESASALGTIQIYDVNGRVLKTLSRDSKQASIDVSDLPNGLYFMRINSASKVQTLKFIKK